MISLADLKESDKGRSVIYRPAGQPDKFEVGRVTSWNTRYVFVRYGNGDSMATNPRDLEWEFEEKGKA